MNEQNVTLLTAKEISSREDVLTVIQSSFIVEEARAIVSLQTYLQGQGAQCNSFMVHPQTARKLARVFDSIADEYEKYLERQSKLEER